MDSGLAFTRAEKDDVALEEVELTIAESQELITAVSVKADIAFLRG